MKAAERMKTLVESKGVSYTFISEKTGIPVNAISRSLMGKRRLPADEMILICNVIGVDLGDFDRLQEEPQAARQNSA